MGRQIKIKIDSPLVHEYTWTMGVFGRFAGFEPVVVSEGEDLLIAEHGMGDIQVSHFFRQVYQNGDFHFKSYFRKSPLHQTAWNKPDYLSTCFFLLSYLQEYTDYAPDTFGRFPYKSSVQHHFSCIDQNLVSTYFTTLYNATPKLKALGDLQPHPAQFFLSHDIDTVHGALAQNGKWLLRKGRISALMQLIYNHYIGTPDQMLLQKIMDIEDEFDVRSVFFWIVNSGKGTRAIHNADYRMEDKRIRAIQQEIKTRGWVNGLHKSAGRDTYPSELKRLGPVAEPVNRNHYLLTELPNTFDAIEEAGIRMDATMGFPDAIGFRNSYGLPVSPFNIKEKRAYQFVEVPLTVMDTTLRYYNNRDAKKAEQNILAFLEANPHNALISILWHNNYFFDQTQPGWIDTYKSVLKFISERQFAVLLPDDIIRQYA